ncbi:OLC1v1009148C1 [Oldenlandia corymbosa var. corymbosa]|uniref:OLC1v1009148C1 n=1 Tax=Oldenlandia corymbosa var. corymbosa TaxID=529605 RepID=A0AAV1DNH9_OLDCO|nr:OLC1v1009148C1 [Oldenlandia corymbosa var. corymbosa]
MKILGIPVTELVSGLGGILFLWSAIDQFLPKKFQYLFQKWCNHLVCFIFPRIYITFNEYCEDGRSNEAYSCIKNYLSTKSVKKAEYLKAEKSRNSKSLEFTLDEGDEVVDEFRDVKITWVAYQETIKDSGGGGSRNGRPFEKRYFILKVHSRYRDLVMEDYMNFVMKEGNAIEFKNRKRRLYTNNKDDDSYWKGRWSYINFQHPATFDSLGMDPEKKEEILDDLDSFKNGKDYYKKIGKAWKRGYLLYGPPGSGKSTMIAAMANYLDYDIYDLELTTVKENAELKQLLIETSNKSIIVIEDIDCSLNLTGSRKKNEKGSEDEKRKQSDETEDDKNKSKVTLSGLLNFIDGIWSACGEERVIVFTTNHVEKLDPALIRRGRMDMHIEMSYCKFETFKILAKNYLGIDEHPLFAEIRELLEEKNVCPCDVAENLMPRGKSEDHVKKCLVRLIEAIKATDNNKGNIKEEEEEEEGEVQDENTPTYRVIEILLDIGSIFQPLSSFEY